MNARHFSLVLSILLMAILRDHSPYAQNAHFKFGAAGDFGLSKPFKATASTVAARKLDFMIALGDLSYNANGEEEWCKFWIQGVQFPNLLLVPGNHDTNENTSGEISDYLIHCGNPFQSFITGLYPWQYHFDYPTNDPLARFIMVSPGIQKQPEVQGDYSVGTPGFDFVSSAIDDARAKGLKWIFVSMHKNYISTFLKRNEISKDQDRTFMTMLLNKRVDVILQAHEHGYERTKQLATNPSTCPMLQIDTFNSNCVVDSDNELVKGAGTVILIIGTGGKGMDKLIPSDSEYSNFVENFLHKERKTFGFGEFNVSAKELSYTFVRSDGPEFEDSFRISERP